MFASVDEKDVIVFPAWSTTPTFYLQKAKVHDIPCSIQCVPQTMLQQVLTTWQTYSFAAPDVLGTVNSRDGKLSGIIFPEVESLATHMYEKKKNVEDSIKQVLQITAAFQAIKMISNQICASHLLVQKTNGRVVLAGLTHIGQPLDHNTWSADEMASIAPEVALGCGSSDLADSWSSGFSLFQALTGTPTTYIPTEPLIDYVVSLRGTLPTSHFKDKTAPKKLNVSCKFHDVLDKEVEDKNLVDVLMRLTDTMPARRYSAQRALDALFPPHMEDEHAPPRSWLSNKKPKKEKKEKEHEADAPSSPIESSSSNTLSSCPSTTTTTTTSSETSSNAIPSSTSHAIATPSTASSSTTIVISQTPASSSTTIQSYSTSSFSTSNATASHSTTSTTSRSSTASTSSTSLPHSPSAINDVLNIISGLQSLAHLESLPTYNSLRHLEHLQFVTQYPSINCLRSLNSLRALPSLSDSSNANHHFHFNLGDSDPALYSCYAALAYAKARKPAFKYLEALSELARAEGNSSPPDPRICNSLVALGALSVLAELDPKLAPLRGLQYLAEQLQIFFSTM